QFANNAYMRNGTGYYRYKSLEDFYNQAAPETIALTYGYNGNPNPTAQITFNQFGAYLQDEWSIDKNFKLTYGARFDLLAFDEKDIMTNNAIKALDYGGRHIDTGVWPANHVTTSPRVGFSWDVFGDSTLKIRGGAGLFSRLPSLVFFTNMPTNSNMIQNVARISTSWKGKNSSPDPLLAAFAGPIITDKAALLDKMNSLDPKMFPKTIDPKDGVIGSEVDGVDPTSRSLQRLRFLSHSTISFL
ncbi:MAG: TonB-dependent receptor, partial [Bacteroidales bacterium]|nr:TonB-dependent receptor [Bacteroidales bacterium]